MTNMIDRYFDLLASGDKDRIRCVLNAGVGGAVMLGVAGAAFPNPVTPAVGAVVGLILGVSTGLKVCGPGTEGSLDNLFKVGNADDQVSRARQQLQTDGSFTLAEANALIDVAIVAAKLGQADGSAPWNAQYVKDLRPILTHLKGANYSGLAAS